MIVVVQNELKDDYPELVDAIIFLNVINVKVSGLSRTLDIIAFI
jgi:hypothetical protein